LIKPTILVVEDDPDIQELIVFNLTKEGYTVLSASSGERALELVSPNSPMKIDLILLDIMLPGTDGLEVLRLLKKKDETEHIPIIMTTAKSEDSDIITGLELGADDYLTKPFSPKVLIARLRALLRRRESNHEKENTKLIAADLSLDTSRHLAKLDGHILDLSATEFALLEFLMRNKGWVYSRNQIIDAIKGKDYPVTERSVDVQILGLRKKLGTAGELLQTVRGVGYRFVDEETK